MANQRMMEPISGSSKRRASGSWQKLDPAAVEARQRVFQASSGDRGVRDDFRERHQHEGTLEQARMRQGQVGLIEMHVVISEKVDVEAARPPALLGLAV